MYYAAGPLPRAAWASCLSRHCPPLVRDGCQCRGTVAPLPRAAAGSRSIPRRNDVSMGMGSAQFDQSPQQLFVNDYGSVLARPVRLLRAKSIHSKSLLTGSTKTMAKGRAGLSCYGNIGRGSGSTKTVAYRPACAKKVSMLRKRDTFAIHFCATLLT
jgi:hypothetical protein